MNINCENIRLLHAIQKANDFLTTPEQQKPWCLRKNIFSNSLGSFMTLDKIANVFEPQFPHL